MQTTINSFDFEKGRGFKTGELMYDAKDKLNNELWQAQVQLENQTKTLRRLRPSEVFFIIRV